MKKNLVFVALFIFTTLQLEAQNKEKIKGSKVVTESIYEIENFKNIEIEDNLEIVLSKSDSPSIEINADDNLHDAINYTIVGNTLKISTFKDVIRAKKFSLRINYTDSLHSIVARGETKISGLNNVELENLDFSTFDKVESALNLTVKNLTLSLNDKSEAEFNINSKTATVQLSQYSRMDALLFADESVKLDMYQNSKSEIEGETIDFKIRLDNSSNLTAKKLKATTVTLVAEGYARTSIQATESVSISASGKSQIELYGEPKVEVPVFTNTATLYKKEF